MSRSSRSGFLSKKFIETESEDSDYIPRRKTQSTRHGYTENFIVSSESQNSDSSDHHNDLQYLRLALAGGGYTPKKKASRKQSKQRRRLESSDSDDSTSGSDSDSSTSSPSSSSSSSSSQSSIDIQDSPKQPMTPLRKKSSHSSHHYSSPVLKNDIIDLSSETTPPSLPMGLPAPIFDPTPPLPDIPPTYTPYFEPHSLAPLSDMKCSFISSDPLAKNHTKLSSQDDPTFVYHDLFTTVSHAPPTDHNQLIMEQNTNEQLLNSPLLPITSKLALFNLIQPSYNARTDEIIIENDKVVHVFCCTCLTPTSSPAYHGYLDQFGCTYECLMTNMYIAMEHFTAIQKLIQHYFLSENNKQTPGFSNLHPQIPFLSSNSNPDLFTKNVHCDDVNEIYPDNTYGVDYYPFLIDIPLFLLKNWSLDLTTVKNNEPDDLISLSKFYSSPTTPSTQTILEEIELFHSLAPQTSNTIKIPVSFQNQSTILGKQGNPSHDLIIQSSLSDIIKYYSQQQLSVSDSLLINPTPLNFDTYHSLINPHLSNNTLITSPLNTPIFVDFRKDYSKLWSDVLSHVSRSTPGKPPKSTPLLDFTSSKPDSFVELNGYRHQTHPKPKESIFDKFNQIVKSTHYRSDTLDCDGLPITLGLAPLDRVVAQFSSQYCDLFFSGPEFTNYSETTPIIDKTDQNIVINKQHAPNDINFLNTYASYMVTIAEMSQRLQTPQHAPESNVITLDHNEDSIFTPITPRHKPKSPIPSLFELYLSFVSLIHSSGQHINVDQNSPQRTSSAQLSPSTQLLHSFLSKSSHTQLWFQVMLTHHPHLSIDRGIFMVALLNQLVSNICLVYGFSLSHQSIDSEIGTIIEIYRFLKAGYEASYQHHSMRWNLTNTYHTDPSGDPKISHITQSIGGNLNLDDIHDEGLILKHHFETTNLSQFLNKSQNSQRISGLDKSKTAELYYHHIVPFELRPFFEPQSRWVLFPLLTLFEHLIQSYGQFHTLSLANEQQLEKNNSKKSPDTESIDNIADNADDDGYLVIPDDLFSALSPHNGQDQEFVPQKATGTNSEEPKLDYMLISKPFIKTIQKVENNSSQQYQKCMQQLFPPNQRRQQTSAPSPHNHLTFFYHTLPTTSSTFFSMDTYTRSISLIFPTISLYKAVYHFIFNHFSHLLSSNLLAGVDQINITKSQHLSPNHSPISDDYLDQCDSNQGFPGRECFSWIGKSLSNSPSSQTNSVLPTIPIIAPHLSSIALTHRNLIENLTPNRLQKLIDNVKNDHKKTNINFFRQIRQQCLLPVYFSKILDNFLTKKTKVDLIPKVPDNSCLIITQQFLFDKLAQPRIISAEMNRSDRINEQNNQSDDDTSDSYAVIPASEVDAFAQLDEVLNKSKNTPSKSKKASVIDDLYGNTPLLSRKKETQTDKKTRLEKEQDVFILGNTDDSSNSDNFINEEDSTSPFDPLDELVDSDGEVHIKIQPTPQRPKRLQTFLQNKKLGKTDSKSIYGSDSEGEIIILKPGLTKKVTALFGDSSDENQFDQEISKQTSTTPVKTTPNKRLTIIDSGDSEEELLLPKPKPEETHSKSPAKPTRKKRLFSSSSGSSSDYDPANDKYTNLSSVSDDYYDDYDHYFPQLVEKNPKVKLSICSESDSDEGRTLGLGTKSKWSNKNVRSAQTLYMREKHSRGASTKRNELLRTNIFSSTFGGEKQLTLLDLQNKARLSRLADGLDNTDKMVEVSAVRKAALASQTPTKRIYSESKDQFYDSDYDEAIHPHKKAKLFSASKPVIALMKTSSTPNNGVGSKLSGKQEPIALFSTDSSSDSSSSDDSSSSGSSSSDSNSSSDNSDSSSSNDARSDSDGSGDSSDSDDSDKPTKKAPKTKKKRSYNGGRQKDLTEFWSTHKIPPNKKSRKKPYPPPPTLPLSMNNLSIQLDRYSVFKSLVFNIVLHFHHFIHAFIRIGNVNTINHKQRDLLIHYAECPSMSGLKPHVFDELQPKSHHCNNCPTFPNLSHINKFTQQYPTVRSPSPRPSQSNQNPSYDSNNKGNVSSPSPTSSISLHYMSNCHMASQIFIHDRSKFHYAHLSEFDQTLHKRMLVESINLIRANNDDFIAKFKVQNIDRTIDNLYQILLKNQLGVVSPSETTSSK
jgi:hypothetical protein